MWMAMMAQKRRVGKLWMKKRQGKPRITQFQCRAAPFFLCFEAIFFLSLSLSLLFAAISLSACRSLGSFACTNMGSLCIVFTV